MIILSKERKQHTIQYRIEMPRHNRWVRASWVFGNRPCLDEKDLKSAREKLKKLKKGWDDLDDKTAKKIK